MTVIPFCNALLSRILEPVQFGTKFEYDSTSAMMLYSSPRPYLREPGVSES